MSGSLGWQRRDLGLRGTDLLLSRKARLANTAAMETLDRLLDRLKARQRDLIMEAAQYDTMPADSTLKRVAELENAIAAVEAVADEERCRRDR
ncbi:hypothetical protein MKK70_00265 [Methylobacterium sp. E-041]|uniref:hypothetical protein n=1 Tax=Methylobacterium sp. E-041 TaxID=2836573 RepID=UPI001FBA604A|nr:hypothetical protein [Methylobacterium sp. E-041]MCJ2103838.1 hypothetical protein [Methylobacterium sp. E-041]